MASTSVVRNVGQTYKLAVTATSSTSLLIEDNTNDQVNYVQLLNVGSSPCAVKMSSLGTCPAAVFPAVGTPGDYVLPPLMEIPMVVACPTAPFSLTSICPAAGTTDLYITPTADQS